MIPLATTTITVFRIPLTAEDDPLDDLPDAEAVASGVRAHISVGTGAAGQEEGMGQQEVLNDLRLSCDPTDIQNEDVVHDEKDGRDYQVTWVQPRYGLGLDHMEVGLKRTEGVP